MKKVLSVAAVALLLAGLTGCCCSKSKSCSSKDGAACAAEKGAEGCSKESCEKSAE